MGDLLQSLTEKRGLSEKTGLLYIKNLLKLNNNEPFNNLMFLKNYNIIDNILNKYKDNTKKTILSGIVSILTEYKNKTVYKKIYNHYYNLMMNKAEEMKNINQNEKTNKENENWMDWESIINIKNNYSKICDEIVTKKMITIKQYKELLYNVILSLYTELGGPRRNQDFLEMYVIKEYDDSYPKNKNYLDITKKKLIYNVFKTSKKYGTQIIDFNDKTNLINALNCYLKFHPLNPSKKDPAKIKNNIIYKLLVFSDGSPLETLNSITRILNRIFKKRIGSSMLRHIYLSSKYNINEMKEDAYNMGHSLEQQRAYLKE